MASALTMMTVLRVSPNTMRMDWVGRRGMLRIPSFAMTGCERQAGQEEQDQAHRDGQRPGQTREDFRQSLVHGALHPR